MYANASYTISRQHNFNPNNTLGTKDYLDAFDPSIVVDGQNGTGIGSPFWGAHPNAYPVGTYRNWAMPDTIFNVGATYMLTDSLGVSGSVQIIKEYELNASGSLVIPTSYEFDFSIFYRVKSWEIKLDLLNAFDERIITPVSQGSANELIMVKQPRRMAATIKYRF